MDTDRVSLPLTEIPGAWYNILADLPQPLPPPLHPGTCLPLTPDDLAPLFPAALIEQEVSGERWIPIPAAIRDLYRIWRPTPLVRAIRLERALRTSCRIYFKNESVSPAGSHKLNTALAQAYYNQQAGVRRLTTETGAGQWGSALSFACQVFGLECTVYMVKSSYHQKPYRRSLMHVWGAKVHPSPSRHTKAGQAVLAGDPESPGSLGIAISEAVEDAASHDDAKYSLGSVLNHVLTHQTVIGLETRRQLELIGERPDVLIACVGGGSNFGGFVLPFMPDKFANPALRVIAVEPSACPSLTKGLYAYDFGDMERLTPLVKMYTLGHRFVPAGIHAGGLRYHGTAPIVAHLAKLGHIEARSYAQNAVFESAVLFARTEGFVPAPETAHAIRAAIDEARKDDGRCIVFNYSGHGHFDMSAYDDFLAGKLLDYEHPDEEIAEALKQLPKVAAG
jgi:tryptophan synthase beta chain